jgi:hypothetical protein
MNELDRDVARIGLILRRCAACQQAPAREEAAREQAAELRDPRGLRREEALVRDRPPREQLLDV